MNKSDVCRGCMNEITYNGVSLLNSNIAQLYQNCTRIEINKDDLISNSLCDDCFLKCNQWKTFKDQCEYSEQELRELSIKQVKSAINEIEFLDLGLEIKEEESDQENGFDNSFIPEYLDDRSSCSEDDTPLTEHVALERRSSLEDDKPIIESVERLSSSEEEKPLTDHVERLSSSDDEKPLSIRLICKNKLKKMPTGYAEKLREPLKMIIKEAKHFSKDVFYISQTPTSKLETQNVKSGAKKYVMVKNYNGQWDKEDTEYKYTPGRSRKLIAYKCKICNQVFRQLNIYELHFMRVHMKNKEPIYCRICNDQYSRKLFLIQHLTKRHLANIKIPTLKCEECDIGFEKEKQLKNHNKIHENKNLIFKCEECDNSFSTESQLKRHGKLHLRFYCDQCNKCFNRKFSLKLHEKTHIEDRPFICSTCNFAFKTNVNLQSHIKIHKNERNFICPTCGKMFIRSHALKKHMFAHTDERPFKCPHCPRASKSSQQFKKHMETHNTNAVKPHICEFCNRSFRVKKVYVHHRMTHTGERPHECNLCDRKFIQTIALKKHMKTHEAI